VEIGDWTHRRVHESFRRGYPGRMSTKVIRTGADVVGFGASVKVTCRACGTDRILSGLDFARECGTGSLGTTAKHLKCDNCAEKRAQLLVLPAG
jgi:hypothetical protein